MELYDLQKLVGAEIGSISGVVWDIPRISNKSRAVIFTKLNAVSKQFHAHFLAYAAMRREQLIEETRRRDEDRVLARRQGFERGIEAAVESLRVHAKSIDAHLAARGVPEAERETLRLFVVSANALLMAAEKETR